MPVNAPDLGELLERSPARGPASGSVATPYAP